MIYMSKLDFRGLSAGFFSNPTPIDGTESTHNRLGQRESGLADRLETRAATDRVPDEKKVWIIFRDEGSGRR